MNRKDIKILILNCDFEKVKVANESYIFSKYLRKKGIINVLIKNVYKNEFPTKKELRFISGIIITGSNYSVYEKKAWISKLLKLIRYIKKEKISTLGVCFGSQAVAKALGGEVVSSKSEEIGFKRIELSKKALICPLYKGIIKNPIVCTWHNDNIVKLPKKAVLLAKTKFSIQSFSIENMYCTQFHPEFDKKTVAITAKAENTSVDYFDKKVNLKYQRKILENAINILTRKNM